MKLVNPRNDFPPASTFLCKDFLIRNRERFASNNRIAMSLNDVDRINDQTRVEITRVAKKLRRRYGVSGAV